MFLLLLTVIISSGITAWILYQYFYHKEKKLLYRLFDMIEQAETGHFQPKEISEEEISFLEHHMKKFLDSSLLEKGEQKQQKEMIQSLISDISHQTLTPITNLKIGLYLAREIIKAQHGYIKVQSKRKEGSVFSVFLPVSES